VRTIKPMMQLTIFIPERQQPVHLRPGTLNWSEDEFFEFCQANRDLRIERSAQGETTEYLGCGLRLGWLILPATARADVCTAVGVETFGSPATISADPVLPGFTLELTFSSPSPP